MKIQVLNVEKKTANNKSGKPYSFIELAYKNVDSGKVEGKKLMEFTNRDVYDGISKLPSGAVVNVTTQKNVESGYWDWVAIGTGEDAPPATSAVAGKPAPKSTYETPEERAARQVMIVRQSSLSTAVALLKTDKVVPKVEEIIDTAKKFEAYVFGTTAKEGNPFDDFTDDVPL